MLRGYKEVRGEEEDRLEGMAELESKGLQETISVFSDSDDVTA